MEPGGNPGKESRRHDHADRQRRRQGEGHSRAGEGEPPAGRPPHLRAGGRLLRLPMRPGARRGRRRGRGPRARGRQGHRGPDEPPPPRGRRGGLQGRPDGRRVRDQEPEREVHLRLRPVVPDAGRRRRPAALSGLVSLFPLPNVVLFPGAPLPLHVFEPRYRRMVADALASHRTIGMVLLKPGYEEGYHGRPPIYPLGCSGAIVEEERLEDGRYNILLLGQSRFRVLEEYGGEAYRLAAVEELPDATGDAASLDDLRERLLASLSRLSDGAAAAHLEGGVSHAAPVNGPSPRL